MLHVPTTSAMHALYSACMFVPHVPRKHATAAGHKCLQSRGRLCCGCGRREWRLVRFCLARPVPPRNECLAAREHPARGARQHKQPNRNILTRGQTTDRSHSLCRPIREGSFSGIPHCKGDGEKVIEVQLHDEFLFPVYSDGGR